MVSIFGENDELITEIHIVDYSAFGAVLDESSPARNDGTIGFAGAERDTATALEMALRRVENPETGTWDSQEPLGFAGGDDNVFGYVPGRRGNAPEPGTI
jgi:RHS repeat-associated protein